MHISVIAKEPRPGLVKTRLCPPCTPVEAAAVAAAALADTLDGIDVLAARFGTAVERVLLFDGDASEWARPGWRVHSQRGDGLGDRLANGFDDLGRGVIVGMESPHVTASLEVAVGAMLRGDDAIGLAADGGYWAIALASVDRRVFDGVPMSTSQTGLAQLSALHRLQRSVRRLPFARDLDTFDDVIDAATRRDGTPALTRAAQDVLDRVDGRRAIAASG